MTVVIHRNYFLPKYKLFLPKYKYILLYINYLDTINT